MAISLNDLIDLADLPTAEAEEGTATGGLYFQFNPLDGDGFTIGGLEFTFAAEATGFYIQIGASPEETVQNIKLIADQFSEIPNQIDIGEGLIALLEYTGSFINVTANMPGEVGLAINLAVNTPPAEGFPVERIIINAMELSGGSEGGIEIEGVDAEKSSSVYEGGILSLIEVIASLLVNTENAEDDQPTTRKQRVLLKRMLQWAAVEVPSTTGDADDREGMYDRIKTKLFKRYQSMCSGDV